MDETKKKKVEIEIFLSSCSCSSSFSVMVNEIVAELDIKDVSISQTRDFEKIAERGILMPPALAINGTIVVEGIVPRREKLKALIEEAAKE